MTTNHPPLPLAHGRAPSLAPPMLALFLAVAGCGSGPGSDSGLSSAASTCPDFLACAQALGVPTEALIGELGEDGSCWEGDTEACEARCRAGLDALALPDPGPAACQRVEPRPACDLAATGDAIGQVTADIALEADDRSSVRLHDLCETWVVLYHNVAWLRIEDSRVEATALHRDFAASGVVVLGVLVEDRQRRPATAQAARAERSDFDLPFRVVADPEVELPNRFNSAPSYPSFTVLGPGAVVEERWTTARGVRDLLDGR